MQHPIRAHDVRMDVVFVYMSTDKKCVFSFQKPFGQLIPDPVGFLRRDLTRLERLADLIGDHIAVLFASSDGFILPLGKKKLRIGGVRITLVCGDQFVFFGFVGVHCVVGALGQALRDGLALVLMHGNDAGCGDIDSPPCCGFGEVYDLFFPADGVCERFCGTAPVMADIGDHDIRPIGHPFVAL